MPRIPDTRSDPIGASWRIGYNDRQNKLRHQGRKSRHSVGSQAAGPSGPKAARQNRSPSAATDASPYEGTEREERTTGPAEVILRLQRLAGNLAVRRLIQRDDWSGPSYARHGPADSAIEGRRGALTPQQSLGETEARLAGEAAAAVGWIGDGISKLIALEGDLRKSEQDGKPFFGENTLDFASRVHQIVEALQKLTNGVLATREKVKDANASLERFEQMDAAVKAMGRVINAMQVLKSGQKTNEALNAFQAKPSAQTAEAWADSVVDSFDAFGKIVGSLDLPPGLTWIVDYYQGLMGAPKAYVGFFKATMHARYAKIDREVGITDSYVQKLVDGEKTVWAGPSCPMVSRAFFFDSQLQNWIFSHQYAAGKNHALSSDPALWSYGTADVVAILLDALGRDSSIPAETRERWMAWLATQK